MSPSPQPQPQPLSHWGQWAPMNRCFGTQQAQVQDHQSRGRRNRKYMESAPLIQTIWHSWGLSKHPINKRWQPAGCLNQRPRTTLSLHHFVWHCICPSFSYLYFYISLSSCSCPPLPSPPLVFPEKTHFYLAQKINSDCG